MGTQPFKKLDAYSGPLSPKQAAAGMQSEPELELWVKHLRPVWRRDMASMKRALLDCYQEASDLRVLRGNQKVEDMVRFLL